MDLEDDVAMDTLKLNSERCIVGTSSNNDLTSVGNNCIDVKGTDDLLTGVANNSTLSADREKDILQHEIGNDTDLMNNADIARRQNLE